MTENTPPILTGALYNKLTGRVIARLNSNSNAGLHRQLINRGPEISLFEGVNREGQYIDITQSPPTLKDKTPLIADFDSLILQANGNDFITLSNLPEICTVWLDQEPHEITDGVFEFDALSPGVYEVYVDEVKHFRKDWTINVN